jgi:AAA15 family ATPase/GTPase
MSELLLDSLEIKGYRCFEHLTIEKLGRVNLIVGKNSVGKTAFLEAVRVFWEGGNPEALAEITLDRNERVADKINNEYTDNEPSLYYFNAFRNLFYNYPSRIVGKSEHYVGKIEINSKNKQTLFELNSRSSSPVIKNRSRVSDIMRWNEQNSYFVKTEKITGVSLLELWRNVELRVSEEFVTSALRIVYDDLISVRLTEYPEVDSPKIPIARVNKFSEPVPLSSLGEGMNRMFSIALALANYQNKTLLIDEIEIGLHYSVLPDVWKLIFKTAKDLNVQVFATTHSKDCIEAFTQAAIDDEESEGMLIRLERQGEKIVAKTVVEERLALAIEHGVEMR